MMEYQNSEPIALRRFQALQPLASQDRPHAVVHASRCTLEKTVVGVCGATIGACAAIIALTIADPSVGCPALALLFWTLLGLALWELTVAPNDRTRRTHGRRG